MELTVWPPRWNAASMDPACLAVLAYLRFSGAPVQVKVVRPTLAASLPSRLSELPRLCHGADHRICSDPDRLFAYLRKENYGVEYDFSEARLVRMTALLRAVRARLVPAVERLLWLDSRVYTRVTRPAFAEVVGLPVSLIYPSVRHQATRSRLLAGFGYDLVRLDEESLLRQVTTDGVDCIRRLSDSLGGAKYFVSDSSPCCLDAMVFGYLWPLLKAPLLNTGSGGGASSDSCPQLVRELRRRQNLVDFCQRIQRVYFPELSAFVASPADAGGGADGGESANASSASSSSFSEERSAALRNAGLFLALTGAVFGFYAWEAGWIVVQS